VDLPTYTNIWRIEKRLYKLYDFRLPAPLPISWIAVFTGITVPYVVLLVAVGLPFNHDLVWLYVLPPGVLTWLTTRPVIENKRLPELLTSQVRYLTEPRVWCRLAPLAERDEVIVVARVWHSRRVPAPAKQGVVAKRGLGTLVRRDADQDAKLSVAPGPKHSKDSQETPRLDKTRSRTPARLAAVVAGNRREPAPPLRPAAPPAVQEQEPVLYAATPTLIPEAPAIPEPVRQSAPQESVPYEPLRYEPAPQPGMPYGPVLPGAPANGGPPQEVVITQGEVVDSAVVQEAVPDTAIQERARARGFGRAGGRRTWVEVAHDGATSPAPPVIEPEVAPGNWARGIQGPSEPASVREPDARTADESGDSVSAEQPAAVETEQPAAVQAEQPSAVEAVPVEEPVAVQAALEEHGTEEAAEETPVETVAEAPVTNPPPAASPPVTAPLIREVAAPATALAEPAVASAPPAPSSAPLPGRLVPSIERALAKPDRAGAGADGLGWRRKVKVVTGTTQGPGKRDQETLDRDRARLPLSGAKRILVLGCTSGAGQTVTALMTGYILASLREHPVATVDLHDGALARHMHPAAQVTALLNGGTPKARPTTALDGLPPGVRGEPNSRAEPNGHALERSDRSEVPNGRLDVIASGNGTGEPLGDSDITTLAQRLGAHYPIAMLDPGPSGLTRLLAITDQLVIVVPASGDAAPSLTSTRDWLEAHGFADLAGRSVILINGVSRRSIADVEAAESVARGRCRAIVRVPWDDSLPVGAAGPTALLPQTRVAYTALAGVLVAGMAAAPVRVN